MKFEIEDGIPVPRREGRPRKYDLPLEKMSRGQTINIELPKSQIPKEAKIIRNYCFRFTQKNPNYKFTVRSLDDGVGIWRLWKKNKDKKL